MLIQQKKTSMRTLRTVNQSSEETCDKAKYCTRQSCYDTEEENYLKSCFTPFFSAFWTILFDRQDERRLGIFLELQLQRGW